jgi:peroxiredoxin
MKTTRIISVAAIVGVAAVGLMTAVSAQTWKAGEKAPNFSAKANDGKTYTLASVTKKGPVVLYFIKLDCPTNDQAFKYYERIAEAYKGTKTTFIGVINGDDFGCKEWTKSFKAKFPILLDPDMKIISSYRAQRSPWVIMVGKDGKIQKEWPGYSNGYLTELSNLMAKGAGVKTKKCDFSGSPTNPRYG